MSHDKEGINYVINSELDGGTKNSQTTKDTYFKFCLLIYVIAHTCSTGLKLFRDISDEHRPIQIQNKNGPMAQSHLTQQSGSSSS